MTTVADYALLAMAGYPRDPKNAGPPPQGWVKYDSTTDPDSDFDATTFYNQSTGVARSQLETLPGNVFGRRMPNRRAGTA